MENIIARTIQSAVHVQREWVEDSEADDGGREVTIYETATCGDEIEFYGDIDGEDIQGLIQISYVEFV